MNARSATVSKKSWLVLVAGLLVVFLISGVFWMGHRYQQELELKKPLYLLLVGMDINILTPGSMDDPKATTRTDTLILSILDPYKNKISMISVPRDSLVDIPGHGVDRINDASVLGGIPLTKRMVTRLTGCRVDRYMVVNFQTFKQLVDLLGGVEVVVDKKMRYADEYGVYKIKLDPGRQVLNGEKALQYVRFRNEPLGDISRVERQRKLLFAIYRKMNRPANIVKAPALMKVARKYVKTDLSTQEMLMLLKFTRGLKPEKDIASYTLPGNFYEVYWKPDRVQVNKLISSLRPVPPVKK